MLLSGVVVFNGGSEVGNGPLVAFAVGLAGRLELARDDGPPVGRIEGTVVLAGAVASGPEGVGAVPFDMLVTFAEGEAVTVPLAEVGAAPPSDVPADGGAVGAVPLPVEGGGAAPDAEVPLPSGGVGTVVLPGAGAVSEVGSGLPGPGPVEDVPLIDVPLVGRGKISVVVFNGTRTLLVAEAVPFVGSGSAKVVEFKGTMILVAVDAVTLVGMGEAAVVEFNGTAVLVEAGADSDALLGADSEIGSGELAPVPDGGRTDVVPLSVGKGGGVVEEPGNGGKEVSPVGRGAKTVVELAMMMRLVAAADPLMLMVVTPVMAPTDEIALMEMEADVSFPVGSGAIRVVELAGIIALVAGAVSLMMTVVRLPVTIPDEGSAVSEAEGEDALPVGNGAMTVVELRDTMTLVAAAVPLVETVEKLPGIPLAPVVLFANGAEDGRPEVLGGNEGGGSGVTVVTDGTKELFTLDVLSEGPGS